MGIRKYNSDRWMDHRNEIERIDQEIELLEIQKERKKELMNDLVELGIDKDYIGKCDEIGVP